MNAEKAEQIRERLNHAASLARGADEGLARQVWPPDDETMLKLLQVQATTALAIAMVELARVALSGA
jgi:hypothetical protein